MKREGLTFLSAVQFLTRLPVPDPGWEEGRLDRTVKWFPAVGVLVGAVSGLALWIGVIVGLSLPVAVLFALLASTLVTGALHEDGLADTADGIGGGRDVGHRLTIMKDSSIGAYGALALVFAFGFRFALTAEIAVDMMAVVVCLVAAHTLSRLAMTGIVWSLDYARDEATAKIAPLNGEASAADRIVATLTALLALIPIVLMLNFGAAVSGVVLTVVAVFGLRALFLRKLGGWTGDTAGATQVICEIAFLIGVAAWI